MQEIADRVGGEKGDILYFQVATAPHLICGCLDDPHLSIERIAKGYDALEKTYGVSMMNLNLVAFLVTRYPSVDVVFAAKVMLRIGEQWDEGTWEKKEDFDKMKQWAASQGPIVVKARAIEAEALANVQTPEGSRYKIVLEKAYRELLQDCVRSDGGPNDRFENGKFETMIKVGAQGILEDGWSTAMGSAMQCTARKVRAARQDKSPLFPPPPHDSYWMRLDFDWADFSTVAAK